MQGVYFTGGLNADIFKIKETIINTVEIWNAKRDEWKEGELLPETRAGATFVAINGKPHLIGGRGFLLVRIQLTSPKEDFYRLTLRNAIFYDFSLYHITQYHPLLFCTK